MIGFVVVGNKYFILCFDIFGIDFRSHFSGSLKGTSSIGGFIPQLIEVIITRRTQRETFLQNIYHKEKNPDLKKISREIIVFAKSNYEFVYFLNELRKEGFLTVESWDQYFDLAEGNNNKLLDLFEENKFWQKGPKVNLHWLAVIQLTHALADSIFSMASSLHANKTCLLILGVFMLFFGIVALGSVFGGPLLFSKIIKLWA